MTAIPYPNQLALERLNAGISTARELAVRCDMDPRWYDHIEAGEILPTLDEFDRIRAALGDLPAQRLYAPGLLGVIGGATASRTPDYASYWGDLDDSGHLLVSRDETTWLRQRTQPDREVDVFVNLSCGPQHSPHISLDTVNVLQTLGVNFAAGAGRLFCCGAYFRNYRNTRAAYRLNEASTGRSVAWGAKTTAHWCTNCVNAFSDIERRERLRGNTLPATVQVCALLERVLSELGDRVPWKRDVSAKVLVQGNRSTPAHAEASDATSRMLAVIPGVEVLGFVDDEATRVAGFRNAEQLMNEPPLARDEIEQRRERLAELFAARGADTMSPMHHTGYQWWARLSSDRLAVRHPISILADALGCASPDRYQAACRLGDPETIFEQTRPIWTSWGMPEERARELARRVFDPVYAAAHSPCSCGGDGACQQELVEVDVHGGTARSRTAGVIGGKA